MDYWLDGRKANEINFLKKKKRKKEKEKANEIKKRV